MFLLATEVFSCYLPYLFPLTAQEALQSGLIIDDIKVLETKYKNLHETDMWSLLPQNTQRHIISFSSVYTFSSLRKVSKLMNQLVNEKSCLALPDDTQLHIFSFCSAITISTALSSVSKRINQLANNEAIWQTIYSNKGPIHEKPSDLTWKQCYRGEIYFLNSLRKKDRLCFVTNPLTRKSFRLNIDYHDDRLKGIYIKNFVIIVDQLPYDLNQISIMIAGKKIKDTTLIETLKIDDMTVIHLICRE